MFMHKLTGNNIQVSDVFTDVNKLSVSDLIDFILAYTMSL
jgi:hypothetical protein